MKWRLTPIGIITIFLVFIMAQGSKSFSDTPVMASGNHDGIYLNAQDTVPQDSTKKKKKKNKDRDTSQPQKPDTFKTFRP